MNNTMQFSTMEMPAQNDPILCSPIKQRWISETRIGVENSTDWLNMKRIGKAAHFTSACATHRFVIDVPIYKLIIGEYGFLTQIALHFSTVGQAAITAVNLYENKKLLWINDDLSLKADHTFTMPLDNYWEIDPGLRFRDDLKLKLVVSFGEPNSVIPEFCFHSAQARFYF